MTPAELLALADLVETANGLNRDLDAALAPIAGLRIVEEGHPLGRCCYDANGQLTPFPRYTGSVDAAMTLVPSGCGMTITRYWISSRNEAAWGCELATGGTPSSPRQVFDCYDAWSQASAIAAAALRARAQVLA